MRVPLRFFRRELERYSISLVLTLTGIMSTAFSQIRSFPYSENFDTVIPPALPAGWSSSQKRSNGTNDFSTATSTPNSAPHAVLATNSTIPQWLQTPRFDLRGFTPDSIRFWVRRSSTFAGSMIIESSTDCGQSFDLPLGDTLRPTSQVNYERMSFPLPSSLGGKDSVVFRWRVVQSGTGSTATIRLDDICISARMLNDLAVSRLTVLPALPLSGDSVFLRVTIANVGSATIDHASLTATVHPQDASGDLSGEYTVTAVYVGSLARGDTVALYLPLGRLRLGRWMVRVSTEFTGDQDTSNNSLTASIDVGLRPGTLVVNEIQYAPATGEPEWVEVMNVADVPVEIGGWTLSDSQVDAKKPILAGSLRIVSGGMVVLAADSLSLRLKYPGLSAPLLQVPAFPSLNNAGDAVVLFDSRGRMIDSVRYVPAWGGGNGATLERIDPLGESNAASNWSSCIDTLKGTPGEPNSVAVREIDLQAANLYGEGRYSAGLSDITMVIRNVGRQPVAAYRVSVYDDLDNDSLGSDREEIAERDVTFTLLPHDSIAVTFQNLPLVEGLHQLVARVDVAGDQRERNNHCVARTIIPLQSGSLRVNEIMYDPLDGEAEYVEVANASKRPIDLWSCSIHDRPTTAGSINRFVLAQSSCRLNPDELFVLASDSTLLHRFPETAAIDPRRIHILRQSGLGLNNDGDAVWLCGPDSVVVDSVAFLPSWHNPDLGSATGRSLEKIAPRFGSSDQQSWATCADPSGGTPGRQNSVFANSVPSGAALSFAPNPFSPDGDGHDDRVIIRYVLPLPASTIRVRIFDVAGRHVRTLRNGSPAGSEGELIWDGRDEDQQRARIGMYVVLLEAIGVSGEESVQMKGVVVVAGRL